MRRFLWLLLLPVSCLGQQLDFQGGVIGAQCSLAGMKPAPSINTSTAQNITAGSFTVTPVGGTGMNDIVVNREIDVVDSQTPIQVTGEVLATGNGSTATYAYSLAHASIVKGSLVLHAGTVTGTYATTTTTGAISVTPSQASAGGVSAAVGVLSSTGFSSGQTVVVVGDEQYETAVLTAAGGNSLTATWHRPHLSGVTITTFIEQGSLIAGNGISSTLATPMTNYLTTLVTASKAYGRVTFSSNVPNGTNVTADYQYIPSEVVKVTGVTGTTFTATFVNPHASGASFLPGYFSYGKESFSGIVHWIQCDALNNAIWNAQMYNAVAPSRVNDQGNKYSTLATAKYGDVNFHWGPLTLFRLQNFGFNIMAYGSDTRFLPITTSSSNWGSGASGWDNSNPVKIPYLSEQDISHYTLNNTLSYGPDNAKDIELLTNNSHYSPYRGGVPDFYDPNYSTWDQNDLATNTFYYFGGVENMWQVGHETDQTDYIDCTGDGPDFAAPDSTFELNCGLLFLFSGPFGFSVDSVHTSTFHYISQNPINYTKQATVNSLCGASGEYATVTALNTAWGSSYTTCGTSGVHVSNASMTTSDRITWTASPALTSPVDPHTLAVIATNSSVGPNTTCSSGCSITGSGNGTRVTVTPVSMAGIQPSMYLQIDSGASLENVGIVSTTGTTFDIYAYQNHSGSFAIKEAWVIAGDNTSTAQTIGTTFRSQDSIFAVSTTIAATISAGDQYVQPASMTNIHPNMFLLIDSAGANPEIVRVEYPLGPTFPYTPGVTINKFKANFQFAHTGSFTVANAFPMSSGTINGSTGAVSFVLKSALPTGWTLSLDYRHGGWPTGTGLMDEDGGHSWTGSNVFVRNVCNGIINNSTTVCTSLPSNNATFRADADLQNKNRLAFYFSLTGNNHRSALPHTPVWNNYAIGGHCVPARKEIYQAIGTSMDVVATGVCPWLTLTSVSSPNLDIINYITHYAGDFPINYSLYIPANPDSEMFRYTFSGFPQLSTQLLRGSTFNQFYTSALNEAANDTSTVPSYGFLHWDLVDDYGELTNWGVLTNNDNAYDGFEASAFVQTSFIGPYQFTTTAEEKTYGNFKTWLNCLLGSANNVLNSTAAASCPNAPIVPPSPVIPSPIILSRGNTD